MKNANTNNNPNGFSLLEMAITLTIISFLITAILTGQNIKRRQELYQVVTDISTISSAVSQFKTNYSGYYPGDFYTADTGTFPTSGNGDGDIDTSITVLTGAACELSGAPLTANEELIFWQHLQLAGLISGTYDCTTTGEGGLMVAPMKYGFYLAHKASGGRLNIQVSASDGAGLLTTKEASALDIKYDDGNPGITDPVTTTAIMTAADGTGATATDCVTTSTSPDKYNTTNTAGTPCRIYWYLE